MRWKKKLESLWPEPEYEISWSGEAKKKALLIEYVSGQHWFEFVNAYTHTEIRCSAARVRMMSTEYISLI